MRSLLCFGERFKLLGTDEDSVGAVVACNVYSVVPFVLCVSKRS